MNENDTLAKLNPKLGKVLARLVKMQEQFPIEERGERDHGDRPPIGMKPIDTVSQTAPAAEGSPQAPSEGVSRFANSLT